MERKQRIKDETSNHSGTVDFLSQFTTLLFNRVFGDMGTYFSGKKSQKMRGAGGHR